MYLGFEQIDAVPLDSEMITKPGYVGSLKRELMQKHTSQLGTLPTEPEFLIVDSGEQVQGN